MFVSCFILTELQQESSLSARSNLPSNVPREQEGFFSKQFLLKSLGSGQGLSVFSLLFKSQFFLL